MQRRFNREQAAAILNQAAGQTAVDEAAKIDRHLDLSMPVLPLPARDFVMPPPLFPQNAEYVAPPQSLTMDPMPQNRVVVQFVHPLVEQ